MPFAPITFCARFNTLSVFVVDNPFESATAPFDPSEFPFKSKRSSGHPLSSNTFDNNCPASSPKPQLDKSSFFKYLASPKARINVSKPAGDKPFPPRNVNDVSREAFDIPKLPFNASRNIHDVLSRGFRTTSSKSDASPVTISSLSRMVASSAFMSPAPKSNVSRFVADVDARRPSRPMFTALEPPSRAPCANVSESFDMASSTTSPCRRRLPCAS